MPLNPGTPVSPSPDAVMRRLRLVHRAAAELRRGIPVVLEGDSPLAILSSETAGTGAIQELAALGQVPPVLLLAPVRAAAVLRQPVQPDQPVLAVRLPDALLTATAVQALADPTARQPASRQALERVPAPPLAEAAIVLSKLGRLLPALLAVPLAHPAAVEAGGLLRVAAADILAYPADEVAGLRQPELFG